MKMSVLAILILPFLSLNAHAGCQRVLHGTTMTIFGHENLYDIECDGETEERDVVGPDKANEAVNKYEGINEHDKRRDERINEALHQANEGAKLDQEQAQKEESDGPISN